MVMLLPGHCKVDIILKLWKNLLEIYKMIHTTMESENDTVRLQTKIDG